MHTSTPPSSKHTPSQAVEARTREELFTDYIKERDKREREARRAEAKRRQDAFRAIVKESNIPVRVCVCERERVCVCVSL